MGRKLPNAAASTAARARRITRRDFHSSIVPPGTEIVGTPDGKIVRAAPPSGNHPKGLAASPKGVTAGGWAPLLGYSSPASRSGRRPQANFFLYQPLSCASATPSSEDWMNQPLPT